VFFLIKTGPGKRQKKKKNYLGSNKISKE
jgi:hypothetical protein